jgi:hypothetical protein
MKKMSLASKIYFEKIEKESSPEFLLFQRDLFSYLNYNFRIMNEISNSNLNKETKKNILRLYILSIIENLSTLNTKFATETWSFTEKKHVKVRKFYNENLSLLINIVKTKYNNLLKNINNGG